MIELSAPFLVRLDDGRGQVIELPALRVETDHTLNDITKATITVQCSVSIDPDRKIIHITV